MTGGWRCEMEPRQPLNRCTDLSRFRWAVRLVCVCMRVRVCEISKLLQLEVTERKPCCKKYCKPRLSFSSPVLEKNIELQHVFYSTTHTICYNSTNMSYDSFASSNEVADDNQLRTSALIGWERKAMQVNCAHKHSIGRISSSIIF